MWHDVRTLNATATGIFALTLLACAASGIWWVSQRPMFTLRTIRLEALMADDLHHVNELTVRSNVLGKFKGNFFTTDLEQVRTAFESVPWVRRASVRREWPNELIVALEEHEVLGTWGTEGALLSVKGDVFTANMAEADEDRELPSFSGPPGSEKEVLARYGEMHAWLEPLNLEPESVDLSSRYAWTIKLNNGMLVSLGREQDRSTLKTRVQRLVKVWPQLQDRVPYVTSIDMRYQNGLALAAGDLFTPADARNLLKAPAAKKTSTTKTKHI